MGKTYENGRKPHATRSDKMRRLAPTVWGRVLDSLATLAYTLGIPTKTIGEYLVRAALQSKSCIAKCQRWLRFEFKIHGTVYFGSRKNEGYKPDFTHDSASGRMPAIKFHQPQYDVLNALAFSLGCRPATAAGLLVELALHDRQIVMALIRKYAPKRMDDRRHNELVRWLRGLKLNLDGSEYIAWRDFLFAIVDTGRAVGELVGKHFSDTASINVEDAVNTR